jgi:uncharacterized protein
MKFWDSSAIVPVLVEEQASPRIMQLFSEDRDAIVWWATSLECTSAIVRRERLGQLDPQGAAHALDRLRKLILNWFEVPPSDQVKSIAQRLLRVHDLRAADALQLAAALAGLDRDAPGIEMVCLDRRLTLAAQREGLRVLT